MKVRWSPEAADDFAAIVEYIRRDNPDSAQRVAGTLFKGVESLSSFPRIGREGKVRGTRELVFKPLPYIAVYRLRGEGVELIRVLHGAQRWP